MLAAAVGAASDPADVDPLLTSPPTSPPKPPDDPNCAEPLLSRLAAELDDDIEDATLSIVDENDPNEARFGDLAEEEEEEESPPEEEAVAFGGAEGAPSLDGLRPEEEAVGAACAGRMSFKNNHVGILMVRPRRPYVLGGVTTTT